MVASQLHYETRRTPSFLAGLLDKRARADGQVQRLTAMLTDIRSELAQALEHRDACDDLLKNYYAGLDVAGIQTIQRWTGRHGKRGTIVGAIRAFLAAAGTKGVTTSEVGAYLAAVLGVEFATPQARKKWMQNAVGVRLTSSSAERAPTGFGAQATPRRFAGRGADVPAQAMPVVSESEVIPFSADRVRVLPMPVPTTDFLLVT